MAVFPGGSVWAAFMLIGMLPAFVSAAVVLLRYAYGASPEERARAALVNGCVVLTVAGTAADLTTAAAGGSPPNTSLAFVGSATLLAAASFRLRALERVSVLAALNAAAIAFGVVLGEIALFSWLGSRTALLAVGSAILSVLALWAGRFLYGPIAQRAERSRGDATLGRMSQQMAHDLRNPLAAIRGAAQFLQVERAGALARRPPRILDLINEQAARMADVIEQYHRLRRASSPASRS
jgi:two-component system, NtrC family, sensor histidine kinase HydH